MTRDEGPRAAMRLAMICWLGLAACSAGGDDAGSQRAADSTVPADTAAPADTPVPSISYDVDPSNVQAALKYDSATKTVTYPIVSGLTSNNSAWNFNGYANGKMTVVVPLGSKVVMPFSNMDGNVPHSFGITTGTARSIPAAPAPSTIVFPGAETRRFETGLRATERDIVRFTADKAGRYLLICGVLGHGVNGMWIWFEVSASAKQPSIRVSG